MLVNIQFYIDFHYMDKQNYGMGTETVLYICKYKPTTENDRIVIFGWTTPLKTKHKKMLNAKSTFSYHNVIMHSIKNGYSF